ncbi:DUF2569 family protein [Cohnella luojiensis]|uniref:DUF2569 family protein n=1 Tax=Cohnella luojiensis TaxID=652876 RepID=A0A4Y8LPM7_9BACL|nr:DUF2569 family protein [Cohnella luojiensis]
MSVKNSDHLIGIKGWLLVYLVISIISIFLNLWGLYTSYYILNEFNIVHYKLVYEIVDYLLVLVLTTLSIIFICLKKSYTPMFIVIAESFYLGASTLYFVDSRKGLVDWIELIVGFVLGMIWIVYFIKSKRIWNTFKGAEPKEGG